MTKAQEAYTDYLLHTRNVDEVTVRESFTAGYAQGRADLLAEKNPDRWIPLFTADQLRQAKVEVLKQTIERLVTDMDIIPLMTPPDDPMFEVFFRCREIVQAIASEIEKEEK